MTIKPLHSLISTQKACLAFLLLTCLSCNSNTSKYFKDFDPVKKTGIGTIDDDEKNQLAKSNQHYYQPIYHKNHLDSLYIFNVASSEGKPAIMKLKVFEKGTMTIYETSFKFKHDSHFATPTAYYVIYAHEAAQYNYVPYDGWYANFVKPDTAFGGYKLIYRFTPSTLKPSSFDEVDAHGFRDSLFAKRQYSIRNMPGQKELTYALRFNTNFTFDKWLALKDKR